MIRVIAQVALVAALCLAVGDTAARAALVTEQELFGQAINNTRFTAQVIPVTAFTLPVPPNVFSPPGLPTATISGRGGPSDVDFYSFFSAGGPTLFDIDFTPGGFDTILSIFNADGTLIAFDDDSFPPDPGSFSGLDAFVGTINLMPGTYFAAVSMFANFASATFTGTTFTSLTRPDGAFGGRAVIGAAVGNSAFGTSGPQANLAYQLNISTAIPEPASVALMGIGVLGLLAYGRGRTRVVA